MLLGYEPGELPDCSTPQHWRLPLLSGILQTGKAARLNITHVSCRGQALSSSPQNARNSKKRIEGSGFRCEAQQFGETDWRGRCGDAVQSTAKPYARFVTSRLPKRARSPSHGRHRRACPYLSREDRRAGGRRRGRVLPRGHVRAGHGGAPAGLEGAGAPHALRRALGGHQAQRRGQHQRFHRRAVPPPPRVHRLHGHAPGPRGPRDGDRARRRPGPARHEAASRHPEGEHGRPTPHAHLRDDRGSAAAHRAYGRLPHRFLASAPAQEHPAHVPQPRGGRGALRRLVRPRDRLRRAARGERADRRVQLPGLPRQSAHARAREPVGRRPRDVRLRLPHVGPGARVRHVHVARLLRRRLGEEDSGRTPSDSRA